MPTDTSISKIYRSINERSQLQGIIPNWGDAVSWGGITMTNYLSMIGIKVPTCFVL